MTPADQPPAIHAEAPSFSPAQLREMAAKAREEAVALERGAVELARDLREHAVAFEVEAARREREHTR